MFSSPVRSLVLSPFLALGLLFSQHFAVAADVATFDTSVGLIKFEMMPDLCPKTVANFKDLANTSFYDGTVIHRLVPSSPYYIAQGGDPMSRYPSKVASYGQGGPGHVVIDERTSLSKGSHVRGILSMARTNADNSAGSQFFIMLGPCTDFDGRYAPFGRMTEGDDTLTAMQALEVSGDTGFTKPVERLVINSVRVSSEPVAGAYSTRYPAVSVSGVLRDIDRTILGSYHLAISASGLLSGRIQCYGRTTAIVGKLTPVGASTSEAQALIYVDPSAKSPLKPAKLVVSLRRTGAATGTVSLLVKQLEGSDDNLSLRAESTENVLRASRELTTPSLSERYTVSMDRPTTAGAYNAALQGSGYMTVRILSNTKVCTVYGRLPDGSAVSAGGAVSSEGGGSRDVFNLYLEGQAAGGVGSTLSGVLQFFTDVYSSGQLSWHRRALPGSSSSDAVDLTVAYYLSKWTPPTSGSVLAPFTRTFSSSSTDHVGAIQFGSIFFNYSMSFADLLLASDTFSLSSTGFTPLFYSDSHTKRTVLKFSPSSGAFVGSYLDTSSSVRVMRGFEGVCVQSGSTSLTIRGLTLSSGSIAGVAIAPLSLQ